MMLTHTQRWLTETYIYHTCQATIIRVSDFYLYLEGRWVCGHLSQLLLRVDTSQGLQFTALLFAVVCREGIFRWSFILDAQHTCHHKHYHVGSSLCRIPSIQSWFANSRFGNWIRIHCHVVLYRACVKHGVQTADIWIDQWNCSSVAFESGQFSVDWQISKAANLFLLKDYFFAVEQTKHLLWAKKPCLPRIPKRTLDV